MTEDARTGAPIAVAVANGLPLYTINPSDFAGAGGTSYDSKHPAGAETG